jgi:protein-L-isoaspartate(D-aspartate) O-methyltransferase
MTATQLDAAAFRAAMVDQIMSDESVTPWATALAPWRAALATVPRHRFIPASIWVENPDDGPPTLVPFRRHDDPARWFRIAYGQDGPARQASVITQVDDGAPEGPGGGGNVPTSSASCPNIVAVMLAALDAQPGQGVLEIGTGTGYNAALLAYRLGAENVTSIEVDPAVTEMARQALRATGYGGVWAVSGDGADGYSPRAPYDRVLATVAARSIPHAWAAQTRPGGRIVVPWFNSYTSALVVLQVDDDHLATGGVVDEATFMHLRAQRERHPAVASLVTDEDEAERSTTDLHPWWLVGHHGARVAIGQRVEHCQYRFARYDTDRGFGVVWFLDFVSRSWAKLTWDTPDPNDAGEFQVLQHGPRRLWDEVDAAHAWWVDQAKPEADRWRFTITPDGQRIELM